MAVEADGGAQVPAGALEAAAADDDVMWKKMRINVILFRQIDSHRNMDQDVLSPDDHHALVTVLSPKGSWLAVCCK